MNSILNEEKEITYAFNAIQDFFNDIDLYEAVGDTEQLILYAANNKVYKKRNPGDLLFFKNRFEELVKVAFTISASYDERQHAVLDHDGENASPDISRQKDFVPGSKHLPAWVAFPRNLTHQQYFDPYKAIRKFAKHMSEQEWKKTINTLVEYALTNDPVDDEYPSYEIMMIRKRMLQLIEACHLLHVRSNLLPKIPKKVSKNIKKK